jgi:hypothetical protein
MAYIGIPPFGQTARTVTEIVATAGQTNFYPSGGYVPGFIDVYLNGVALNVTDFTAGDGIVITLASAATATDEFKSIAYWPVSIVNQKGIGAQGGGSDKVFYENDQLITANYTITTYRNAMSTGPVTINSGVAVTVPDGSRWVIV